MFLGGTVQRSVAWPRDVNNVYRKRLAAGNRYRIRLNGPPNKDMDLWVWRRERPRSTSSTVGVLPANGAAMPRGSRVSGSIDADEQVTFSGGLDRDIYIQVQGWYSGGRYTLSVKRL